jgi:hypothetical protein
LHELEEVEFFERLLSELVENLLFGPLAFLFDIKTAEVDMVFGLPSSEGSDAGKMVRWSIY